MKTILLATLFTSLTLSALPVVTYSFDEYGNGIGTGPGGSLNLPGALALDPGPGGLAAAFSYSGLGNPPSLVAGDVLLMDSVTNILSDVIRFNPAGTGGNQAYQATLVFYSNINDVPHAPADTGFPTSNYTNVVTLTETTFAPGVDGIVYTPTAGQPGYVAGFDVTYTLVSDTPEPASLYSALGALVVIGTALSVRARSKRA